MQSRARPEFYTEVAELENTKHYVLFAANSLPVRPGGC
jgi:hypothetical protein